MSVSLCETLRGFRGGVSARDDLGNVLAELADLLAVPEDFGDEPEDVADLREAAEAVASELARAAEEVRWYLPRTFTEEGC